MDNMDTAAEAHQHVFRSTQWTVAAAERMQLAAATAVMCGILCGASAAVADESPAPIFVPTQANAQSDGKGTGEQRPPAQEASSPGASIKQQFYVDEIIVTAEKRESNLQNTPISVTAVSGDALRAQSRAQLAGILENVPGVSISHAFFGPTVNIRGVTNSIGQSSSSSTTFYVDSEIIEQEVENAASFFDISRVEVLRGPQGTLYGGNAVGGNVNLITNDPRIGDFDGYASAEGGNYSMYHGEGAVNIPLGDRLALRAAFFKQERDGYTSNGGNDVDTTAARVKLLYMPIDSVRMLLTGNYSTQRGSGPYPVPATDANGAAISLEDQDNPWYTPSTVFLQNDVDIWNVAARVDWDLNFGSLTVLGNYNDNSQINKGDAAFGSPVSGLNGQTRNTQELRLASPDSAPLRWIVGLYREYSSTPVNVSLLSFGINTGDAYDYKESNAVFAQVTVPVTNTLRLTGGARYTKDTQDQQSFTIMPDGTAIMPAGQATFKPFTYKAGLEKDITERSLFYAQVSRGYRAGGLVNSVGNALSPFTPEYLLAYEAGSKNRFFDNRLQINGSVFYYDFSNYQVSNTSGISTFIYNSDGASSSGGEIETSFRATPDDLLNVSVAYLKSDLGTFPQNSGVTAANGKSFDHAPEWTATASYGHTFNLTESAVLTAQVDSSYASSTYTDFLQRTGSNSPAHHVSNANFTFSNKGGIWGLTAYVKNIEDYPVVLAYRVSPAAVYLDAPRTYGLLLTAQF